ncbi:MAG: ABC transporter ATP-binding protein [Alphaproteobacteria bacterium]|nr:ABC transporter ATP-binding protein [Alphaproteobacteria bacterium]
MSLSVEHFSLSIGKKMILQDISFSVSPGEVVVLVGESGCGKSMTALAIMRLLSEACVETGRIILDGNDLCRCRDPELFRIRGRDISMIFQEPMTALNPLMTIGNQVAEALLVHCQASHIDALHIACKTLAEVGFQGASDFLGRYPHELSGGQRQRVCMAMAIALCPRFLLADEPTTALDAVSRLHICKHLRALSVEQGVGILLITHDLGFASAMSSDQVLILRTDGILESGTKQSLSMFMHHDCVSVSADFPASFRSSLPPDPSLPPVLEVRDAVCEYVSFPSSSLFPFFAVKDVSFSIRKGEIVALVGESGCGKSTLMRAILGLETLSAGSVRFDGAPIDLSRRKVQAVFQDPYDSFNPRHRVDRLVSEPLFLLDRDRSLCSAERAILVEEMLELVGLSASDSRKYIHEFSGGQRQRISIARALILRPLLIVLDEATSALDVRSRSHILSLLSRLSSHFSMAYLLVSHDLSLVSEVADRVLVMKAGRLVEEGTTAQLFAQPSHPYTRDLLDAMRSLDRG